jgi:L-fuconolactonase
VIIDVQVHAYERDHPGRPWAHTLVGPPEVTGEDLVEAMKSLGVDGALLVSPFTMYRYDYSYALQVKAAHPGRFGLVSPVDPLRPDMADLVAEWAGHEGAVGLRFILSAGMPPLDDPDLARGMAAAAEHGLPVCVSCPGRSAVVEELARRYPDNQLVIDHLGLVQPLEPPVPQVPFADLGVVLALAAHANVAIKVSGVPTLSHEGFPFVDIRRPIEQVIEAYGVDRCMWGSDWTRTVDFVTYGDAVAAFRDADWLGPEDKAALMGGTTRRIFGWSPGD